MSTETALQNQINDMCKKLPRRIEAFQMTKLRRLDNSEWPAWLHLAWNQDRETSGAVYPTEGGNGDCTVSLMTLEEEEHVVSWDDWIIHAGVNDLYQCRPDIFEALPHQRPGLFSIWIK